MKRPMLVSLIRQIAIGSGSERGIYSARQGSPYASFSESLGRRSRLRRRLRSAFALRPLFGNRAALLRDREPFRRGS